MILWLQGKSLGVCKQETLKRRRISVTAFFCRAFPKIIGSLA
jgi:hypothetical protein